jgi:histidinol-phosphate aminotransferase
MKRERPAWIGDAIARHVASIPPYIPGKPIEELQEELGISGAVKMASNENPLGPSPMALDAVRGCLDQVNVYPVDGAPKLAAALAGRFGVSPESIILGNGSDEILALGCHVFISAGDEAIVGENTFSMYGICVEGFGGRLVRVPLKNRCFDLPAMAKAITDRTRLIFLTIPNNPTGTIVSRSEFESFMKDLPVRGLLVVMDEAYREYVSDPDCPMGVDYLGWNPPVLVLRTFSKFYGLAGMRIGYGVGEPWLIELLNRVRPPFNVNSVAQIAALAALDDTGHQKRSLANNAEGMRFLTEELTAMALEVIPSQANFISVCFGTDAAPIYRSLLQEGVIVRHLASFGMENCLRITVGTQRHNSRFISGLKRILGRD